MKEEGRVKVKKKEKYRTHIFFFFFFELINKIILESQLISDLITTCTNEISDWILTSVNVDRISN